MNINLVLLVKMLSKVKIKSASITLGMIAILAFISSCSSTKFIADDDYLLKSCTISSDEKSFNVKSLEPYYAQRPNSKWFSLIKLPLGIYSLSGRDSTKWINRTLRRIGESPVVFDSLKTKNSCDNMVSAMKSMGYLQAEASYNVAKKNKKGNCSIYHKSKRFVLR